MTPLPLLARCTTMASAFFPLGRYKEVAPMGLTFDLADPLAVVSEVVAGGLSHAAGVQVRDHLVSDPLLAFVCRVFSSETLRDMNRRT